MRHWETTTDDSLAMVRVAWQRLRAEYLDLLAKHGAGHPVEWSVLAQSFIDLNTALEATLVAVSRPAPLDDADSR